MKRFLLKRPGIFYLFLGIFILCNTLANGQSRVYGVIKDSLTNEPLIAATVVIEGTTTGTVTDYNGNYSLFIKEGSYVLNISYLGYTSKQVPFTIKADENVEINNGLAMETVLGGEIVISAQARGQLGAVNRQLNSDKVMNAVSSERIKEFPDDNAAQSISRLPGVHLDGSSVVIRGIEPKMNKILINGVEMPSTDADSRSVSMGMISSNMLSGIEVFKTVTPDMDADAIGGVVNLRLQEAQEGFKYSVLAQESYNSQEKNYSSKLWLDFSNRFLDNRLGLAVNANYGVSNGGYDNVDVGYTYLNNVAGSEEDDTYYIDDITVKDRKSHSSDYGGSVILDYSIRGGKIIFNSMLSNKVNNSLTNSDVHNITDSRRQLNNEHSEEETHLWSNSLQIDKEFGRIKLDGAVSYIIYKSNPVYNYNYDWETTSKSYSGIDDDVRLTMDPVDIYDYAIDTVWSSITNNLYNWEPKKYNENRINATFNAEVSAYNSRDIDIKIKVGGKYNKMHRELDAERLTYGDQVNPEEIHSDFSDYVTAQGQENWRSELKFPYFRDYDYDINDNFMNGLGYSMPYIVDIDKTDKMATELIDKDKLQPTESCYKDDYWGGEELFAGYIMAQIKLWNRLTIIPGFRFESMSYDYSALKTATYSKGTFTVLDTLNKPTTHNDFLPHLHTKLTATNWLDVRFSFNQTLTRPDYKYIVPKLYFNTVAGSGYAGNPYLKPARSSNFDLNLSLHSDKVGLVTIGAFYKKIDGIFYAQESLIKNIPDSLVLAEFPIDDYSTLASGETDYYINNPNMAYLRGMEMEWQSNFSFLPFPFNGIVLNANYTHVWSETDYPKHRVEQVRLTVYPYLKTVENDTVYTNRLIKQANDLGNISLGYDYKGFSVRFSFRFQGNVMSSVSSTYADVEFTKNTYTYDLAIKQQIPAKFARMEVYFNGKNLTNEPSGTYSTYPNLGNRTTQLRYSGPTFQLGFRVRSKI